MKDQAVQEAKSKGLLPAIASGFTLAALPCLALVLNYKNREKNWRLIRLQLQEYGTDEERLTSTKVTNSLY